MSSKMKLALCCFFFVSSFAMGSTGCTARDRETLICSFPNNINTTQNDFGVYFYYDDGGEEPLVDCAWTKSHLHCIKQKGFECKHPVSDTAEIIIPKSFRDKKGSYRCVSDGDSHNNIQSCRLPEMQDQDFSSSCEAKAGSNYQMTVNCTFSFIISGFKIIKSGVVVANYTRSSCHNSTLCEHHRKDTNEIFIVKFVVNEVLYNDYYYCLSSHLELSDNITGCSISNDAADESLSPLIYLAALAFVPVGIVAVFVINLALVRSRDNGANEV